MSSGFEQMLLSKTPAKQGMTTEMLGNGCPFDEIQYMPGYFPAFLFLNSSGMPRKPVVDNGL